MLNAITWCAKAEVPEGGVASKALTLEDMEANQDEPPRKDFNREAMRQQIEKWNE
jgi:hypothetical protein